MATIYKNGLLTISASASSDGNRGLFRQTTEFKTSSFSVRYAVNKGEILKLGSTMCCRRPLSHLGLFDKEDLEIPLRTRAWCYQKHILSPRVLQFTANELI